MPKKLTSMNKKEVNVEHLQMIEGVINRLAGNSASMKGWFLAVITALGGFSVSNNCGLFLWIAVAFGIAFWILDSYYLALERCFRKLYNDVAKENKNIIPFSMDVSKYNIGKKCVVSAMFSPSTGWFYPPIIIGIALVTFFDLSSLNKINHCCCQ